MPAAIIVTDNKNRTVSEIRHLLTKHGGSMAEAGSVAWMFSQKGQIFIDAEHYDEETVFLTASELGAEDIDTEEGLHVVITAVENFSKVKEGLSAEGIEIKDSELVWIPSNTVMIDEKNAEKVLKLMEVIEDSE